MAFSDRFHIGLALVALAGCSIPPETDYVGGDASDAAVDVAPPDAGDSAADVTLEATLPCGGPDELLNSANGHCYRFVAPQLGWVAAESDCKLWSGHLVAIKDGAEQAFVGNIVNVQMPDASASAGIWIGLNDMANPPTYAWSTGEALGFTNWSSSPTGKPCVFFYAPPTNHHWNDYMCDVQASYVCER